VSKSGDKRQRGDLDLFVLALVAEGVSTAYEMMVAAGLSPGATIPALRRLLASRLVGQSKPGPRGRTAHRVTAAGRRHLKTGWQPLIDAGPSGDLDADLRVALMALVVGRQRAVADKFLQQSAARNRASSAKEQRPANSDSLPELATWYRRLRAESATLLAAAERAAALAMADTLPKAPSRIPKRTSARSKA
jgi:DNA-binding PadR family transcriptional regulator